MCNKDCYLTYRGKSAQNKVSFPSVLWFLDQKVKQSGTKSPVDTEVRRFCVSLLFWLERFLFPRLCSGCEPSQWDGSTFHHPLSRPSVGFREVWRSARENSQELSVCCRGEEAEVGGLPFATRRTKWFPKADSSPANTEGHFEPFCLSNHLLPEEHLLCSVWQREHWDIPARDGKDGRQVMSRGFDFFWKCNALMQLCFSLALTGFVGLDVVGRWNELNVSFSGEHPG